MPNDSVNRSRSIGEILTDLEDVATNFDNGWRAEPRTMAALFRRAARDIRSAMTRFGDIEAEMREEACGSQDGYVLSMADRIRAELSEQKL